MPIPIECEGCGFTASVPDAFAGKVATCKRCGAKAAIPGPPPGLLDHRFDFSEVDLLAAGRRPAPATAERPAAVDLEPIVPTLVDAPKSRRRVWSDPVVVAGVAVPAAILAWFAFYLYQDQEQKAFEARVRTLKAEGDRLDKAGHAEDAYRQYAAAIKYAESRRLAEQATKDDLVVARERSVQLYPVATESFRRREAVRKQAEADDQARAKGERERAELVESLMAEPRAYVAERERLSGIAATIVGGAFVVNGLGYSRPIPGLDIYVLPGRVTPSKLAGVLDELRKRPKASRWGDRLDAVAALPPDFTLDLKTVYDMIRETTDGSDSNDAEIRFLSVKKDLLWPIAVLASHTEKVTTNSDGKYRLRSLKGGRYYLYSVFDTKFAFIEWMIPVRVEQPGEIEQDLGNNTASIILNRNAD